MYYKLTTESSVLPNNFTGFVELVAGSKTRSISGQAIEGASGYKAWYKDGLLHRLDGPAIEYAGGTKHWYKDGKWHRLDGPAIEEAAGTKEWYKDGLRHRLDGPAYEWADGSKEWFKDGKYLTESEFNASNNSSNEVPCEVVINGITYKLVRT